jgi:peptidoglycan/xylan/chitin deacetylase (PgdA/CDA1 family)
VGGAQLDKEDGRVRAGADHAGVHVVSVTAKANAGHRQFYGFGYGYCRPGGGARSVDRVVTRRHAAPGVAVPWEPSSFVGPRPEVNQARLLLEAPAG